MSFYAVAEPLEDVKARLGELYDKAVEESIEFRGELTLIVNPECIVEVCRVLHDDTAKGYDYIADLTAIDNLNDDDYTPDKPRFYVVYNLFSTKTKHRLRLRSAPQGDPPKIATVTDVWCGANWHERECYDMFGIVFDSHPDLRRILMPDDWEGHPLRKDYPVRDQEAFQYINKQLATD